VNAGPVEYRRREHRAVNRAETWLSFLRGAIRQVHPPMSEAEAVRDLMAQIDVLCEHNAKLIARTAELEEQHAKRDSVIQGMRSRGASERRAREKREQAERKTLIAEAVDEAKRAAKDAQREASDARRRQAKAEADADAATNDLARRRSLWATEARRLGNTISMLESRNEMLNAQIDRLKAGPKPPDAATLAAHKARADQADLLATAQASRAEALEAQVADLRRTAELLRGATEKSSTTRATAEERVRVLEAQVRDLEAQTAAAPKTAGRAPRQILSARGFLAEYIRTSRRLAQSAPGYRERLATWAQGEGPDVEAARMLAAAARDEQAPADVRLRAQTALAGLLGGVR
jgi:predicted  nucleic acid-binding Zn-ribbon protein